MGFEMANCTDFSERSTVTNDSREIIEQGTDIEDGQD